MQLLPAGSRIGRYFVEAPLGEGGMGCVYRARDEVLHRRVALKVLRADQGPDAALAVKRVLREARMAAALDHPNVVALFDFGEGDGTPFIVMEYVSGRSLRAVLDEGSATPAERLRWLVHVARALAAAHRAGLVHRDVKPENVMIRDDGVVKVLDFGIARRAGAVAPEASPSRALPEAANAGDTHATVEGAVSGTPGYVAPEVILEGTSDARSDQFAWGVLAYEVLSGRLPWSGTDARALLDSALTDAAAPLDAAALALSTDAVAAIARAIEKDPKHRFASMDDLLAALRAPGEPVPSARSIAPPRPVDTDAATLQAAELGALRRPAPETRRSSRLLPIGVALGLVGVASAGLAIVKLRSDPPAPPAAPAAVAAAPPFVARELHRLTLDVGCEEFPSFTADGKSVVYDAVAGHDFHVYALDLATKERRAITSGAGWQYAAQASPDGIHVAYVRTSGGRSSTYLAKLDGSDERFVAEGTIRPTFSPDARAVWAGDAAPTRFDVATLQPGRALKAPPDGTFRVVLELPDGRVAARVTVMNGPTLGVALVSADGEGLTYIHRGQVEDHITLAPDGASLLVAKVERGGDVLWRVPLDGSPGSLVPLNPAPARGLRFSPSFDRVVWSNCQSRSALARLVPEGSDGFRTVPLGQAARDWSDQEPGWIPGTRTLAVVSDRDGVQNGLWIVDLDGAVAARKLPTEGLVPATPRGSPDGRTLVFAAMNRGIYVMPVDGATAPRALTSVVTDTSPRFSHDGKVVVFKRAVNEERSEILEIPIEGGPTRRLVDGGAFPEPSPAKDEIAYIGHDDVPQLLDLRTMQSRPLATEPLFVGPIAISPDGARALLMSASALVEVDIAKRRVTRRFDPLGDSLDGVAFIGGDAVVSRQVWDGDIWIADGPFR